MEVGLFLGPRRVDQGDAPRRSQLWQELLGRAEPGRGLRIRSHGGRIVEPPGLLRRGEVEVAVELAKLDLSVLGDGRRGYQAKAETQHNNHSHRPLLRVPQNLVGEAPTTGPRSQVS